MRRLRLSAYAALRFASESDVTPVEPSVPFASGEIVSLAVVGPLEHRHSRFCCSYQWLERAAASILATSRPKAVVLDIGSPGGDVEGLFSMCRQLRAMFDAAGVPLIAYVHTACSAAYALAATADRIVIDATGQAGSIGVITEMIDQSASLEAQGIKIRLVTSGTRKADGNSANPLTDEAVAVRQDHVNKLASQFFDYIAERRGLKPDAIAALQAGVFIGADAVAVGLADSVSDFGSFVAQVNIGDITDMDPEKMMAALKAKLESGELKPDAVMAALGIGAETDEEKTDAKAEGDEEKPEAKAEGDEEKPEEKPKTEGAKALGLARMAALAATDRDYAAKVELLGTRADFSAIQVFELMAQPLATVQYAVKHIPAPAPVRQIPRKPAAPQASSAPALPAALAALLGAHAGAAPAASGGGSLADTIAQLDASEDPREVAKMRRAFGENRSQAGKTAVNAVGTEQYFGAVPAGAVEYK